MGVFGRERVREGVFFSEVCTLDATDASCKWLQIGGSALANGVSTCIFRHFFRFVLYFPGINRAIYAYFPIVIYVEFERNIVLRTGLRR